MLLEQLSELQELYRGLMRDLLAKEDKSWAEAMVSQSDMDEDTIVNVAVVLDTLRREESEPTEDRLLEAMEFVDHLDTLNLAVKPKWSR